MTRRRHCRARGVMLVEVLMAISLLVIFMIVAARQFHTIIRLSQQTSEAEARLASYDSAIRVLRADAWGAADVSVDKAEAVTLRGTDGTSVVWRSDEVGALIRAETTAKDAPPRTQAWPELGGRLRFRVEGPVLVVAGDERTGRAGELRLISQVRLAGVKP